MGIPFASPLLLQGGKWQNPKLGIMMNRMNTCLSAFIARFLVPHLFWEKKYYYSKEEKSHVEKAIIDVNCKGWGDRIGGREAIKVYHSLRDGSRLPLVRKTGTCENLLVHLCIAEKGGKRSQTP